VCCSVLQCSAVCCSVLQCIAVSIKCVCRGRVAVCCSVSQCIGMGMECVCRGCVAVCCSVLQCVAVCCSVLQCVWSVYVDSWHRDTNERISRCAMTHSPKRTHIHVWHDLSTKKISFMCVTWHMQSVSRIELSRVTYIHMQRVRSVSHMNVS